MPIYEYRCDTCDQVIEQIQKFTDAPLTKCESCGGALERLISPPGLHFKGTGWYVTDYARASHRPPESKQPVAAGKSDGAAKSGTDSKKPAAPAAKTT
jgi:putative FmdB family regulatory protein